MVVAARESRSLGSGPRWVSLLLVALLSGSLPGWVTPLSGVAEAEACPQRSVVVYTVIFGKVTEVRGAPIAGAVVSSPEDWTTTNAEGHYSIRVDSQCPAELWASHSLYAAQYLYIENPLLASPIPQNFVLPFRLTTSVTPSAFNNNPQKTLTFTTYTTAPQVGTRSIVQLPDGSVLELANVTSDLAGWTKWAGTWTVPAGTPDGRYTFKSCALDELATGNCDSVVGALLSEVRAQTYAVDSVAPVAATTAPPRFADVLIVSSIAVGWQDATSGVDPASLSMWVDGSPVAVTISGTKVSTNASSLSAGIHLVEAQASDFAGNSKRDSFVFTLARLSATSASATLQEMTVMVNPSGAIPPPGTVTFPSPLVSVGGFGETLTASTWVGYGQVRRGFAFSTAEVVFENETGVPKSVAVSIPSTYASHSLAVLAPSAGELSASIPAQDMRISNVVVEVPTGYSTPGSKATLKSVAAPLGPPTVPPGTVPLSNHLPQLVPVVGSLSACMQLNAPSDRQLACETRNYTSVLAIVGGNRLPTLVPVNGPADKDSEAAAPFCTLPDGTGSGCRDAQGGPSDFPIVDPHPSVVFGCPVYKIALQDVNLCTGRPDPTAAHGDGYLGAYLNAFLFAEQGGDHPLWQQNHLDADPDGDYCHNGVTTGRAKATVYRAVTNVESVDTDSPLRSGFTWAFRPRAGDTLQVKLGASTGPTEASSAAQVPVYLSTSEAYQLNHGFTVLPTAAPNIDEPYLILLDRVANGLGETQTVTDARSNLWRWSDVGLASTNTVEGVSGRLQLVTGTEFQTGGAYALAVSLHFQFVADFRGCVP